MFKFLQYINNYLTKGFNKKPEKIDIVIDYSYECSNDYNFEYPVSVEDKKFWKGVSYTYDGREYVLHVFTNLVFYRDGSLFGRIVKNNDMIECIHFEELENKEVILEWLCKCGYLSKNEILDLN